MVQFLSDYAMKKLFAMLMLAAAPVMAEPTKGYYTMDAMGCMILLECTKDVKRVYSIEDLRAANPDTNYDVIADEFNSMLSSLDAVGVKVFLAHEKYFPPMHRGVYHTVGNNFFLNEKWMVKPNRVMSTMRHEGWHAAQDCMAGSIDNTLMAIIKPEEEVPGYWREIVKGTYPEHAVPWEAEAFWAGHTAGMTQEALAACASDTPMWETYPPTPMTREWLTENGYIKD